MWKTLTLEQVCELVTDGSHNSPKNFAGGFPMASVKDMTRERITIETCRTISKEDFLLLVKNGCQPKDGDVLIAKDGATCLDTVCVYRQKDEIVLLSSIAILRPSESLDSDYLRYYLEAPGTKSMLKSGFISGSAIPRVVLKDFRRAPITLPPLSEQRAIARILGALDDKIELNRRMNATLESMARAVFRQWFVEGEEVRRWEEKSLDEIADFLNGLALQKFPADGEEYLPVIKISQLRTNDTNDADKASINVPPQYIVEDGDILFSWSGSLTVVVWCGGKGALNQHLFKVTSDKYPKWFYYYWTKHHLAEFQEIAAGKATTMGHIQRYHLSAAKVLVPSDNELQKMDKLMSPLLDKVIVNNLESRTLASLRDGLLPKLMSGEVRVKDVEKESVL